MQRSCGVFQSVYGTLAITVPFRHSTLLHSGSGATCCSAVAKRLLTHSGESALIKRLGKSRFDLNSASPFVVEKPSMTASEFIAMDRLLDFQDLCDAGMYGDVLFVARRLCVEERNRSARFFQRYMNVEVEL